MKHLLSLISITGMCLFILCGCKKKCGYITFQTQKPRGFVYGDANILQAKADTVYKLEYTGNEFYYVPDGVFSISDPVDTMHVEDCDEITM